MGEGDITTRHSLLATPYSPYMQKRVDSSIGDRIVMIKKIEIIKNVCIGFHGRNFKIFTARSS